MTTSNDPNLGRRTVLRGAAAAATAGLAAGTAGTAAAQSSSDPDYGDWFENTDNFDGTVDETGASTVTITVGATGNGGNFAFGPAAVRVDPGTTVVWEWSGEGGTHNVAAEDGEFESEMTDEAGHTFERTFDSEGVVKYACVPHETMGMKGAVVVGGGGGGDGAGGGGGAGDGDATRDAVDDALTVGSGLGLVGALLAMFAVESRKRATRGERTDR